MLTCLRSNMSSWYDQPQIYEIRQDRCIRLLVWVRTFNLSAWDFVLEMEDGNELQCESDQMSITGPMSRSKRRLPNQSEVVWVGHGESFPLVSGKTRRRICCRSSVGRLIKEGTTLDSLLIDGLRKFCGLVTALQHTGLSNTDPTGETLRSIHQFGHLGKKKLYTSSFTNFMSFVI